MLTNKPIGLQSFTLADILHDDFEGTLKMIKEFGYDGVELHSMYDRSPEYIRDLFKDLDLKLMSFHGEFGVINNNTKAVLDEYETMGIKYVVIPFIMEKYRYDGEAWDVFVNGCKRIGQAARERGMVLCYHNHNFEFKDKIDGEYFYDVIFNTVGRENLSTQMDIGWLGIAKQDPIAYLKKYSGSAPIVHIKDFYFPDLIPEDQRDPNEVDYFDFRPMGKGMLDIPAVVKAAEDAGTEWFIVEQDDKSYRYPELSKLDCVKMSIDYWRSL
ncbi:MAG: sugar phosphate isomerase/epimerase [Clostridia bacterium]|nr:sugar phosphate isomerase/epimerase [Clostridia bacterium]